MAVLAADSEISFAFCHMLFQEADVFWTTLAGDERSKVSFLPPTDSSSGFDRTTDAANAIVLALGMIAMLAEAATSRGERNFCDS